MVRCAGNHLLHEQNVLKSWKYSEKLGTCKQPMNGLKHRTGLMAPFRFLEFKDDSSEESLDRYSIGEVSKNNFHLSGKIL